MVKILQYFFYSSAFLLCLFLITATLFSNKNFFHSKKLTIEAFKSDYIKTRLPEIIAIEKKGIIKSIQKSPIIKKQLDDWEIIKKSGKLRIIVPYSFQFNEFLPRNSLSYNDELELLVHFAQSNQLKPVFISTKKFSDMLPLLEKGFGDVVAANLAITDERKARVNFTLPVDYSTEQLVVATDNLMYFNFNNLEGLNIGVRENSSFWETISLLQKHLLSKQTDQQAETLHKTPPFNVIKLDDSLSSDDKFKLVTSGKIDAVIEDSNRLILFKEYRNDIKAALDINKERPIAWAVRKSNPQLLKQLNEFIKTEKLLSYTQDNHFGDLDSIKKQRLLRLITRNNATSYFLWKNQLMGFEYDLIKQFAKQQRINLKVLIAQDNSQMLQWLENGYGDIISAGLSKTPELEKDPILFSQPYLYVKQVIVQRHHEAPIKTLTDLNQRTFYVQKSSAYWHTLTTLQAQLESKNIHFIIEAVPENKSTAEIIKQVIEGRYDITLVDSDIIDIEKSWNNHLLSSLALSKKQGHRWLVRKSDKKLLAALNNFIKQEYKSLFYNVTYNKYFKNSHNLFTADKLAQNNNGISIYDDLIKSLAAEYDFDWRLIAAQINKESHFNPKAESWTGAKGLLQVMPRTALEMGIGHLEKPENSLRAGLKYMAWIRKQLPENLPVDVRTWFTLAAYNAGLGHLYDAQHLAEKQGLNPKLWYGQVEKAFLLLSKPQYYKQARYGYVRGIEPVSYVKTIQALFELYSKKYPQ